MCYFEGDFFFVHLWYRLICNTRFSFDNISVSCVITFNYDLELIGDGGVMFVSRATRTYWRSRINVKCKLLFYILFQKYIL